MVFCTIFIVRMNSWTHTVMNTNRICLAYRQVELRAAIFLSSTDAVTLWCNWTIIKETKSYAQPPLVCKLKQRRTKQLITIAGLLVSTIHLLRDTGLMTGNYTTLIWCNTGKITLIWCNTGKKNVSSELCLLFNCPSCLHDLTCLWF